MIIDALIVIGALLGFYKGYSKGLVAAIFGIVGIVLAFVLSTKLSGTVAAYLKSHNWVNPQYVGIVSFVLLFIAIMLAIRMAIKASESILKFTMLAWVNKLGGGLAYAFINLFIASVLLWLGKLTKVLVNTEPDSHLHAIVAPIAPATIDKASAVWPSLKQGIATLQGKLP
jgi:membrane protein required for colicin V production